MYCAYVKKHVSGFVPHAMYNGTTPTVPNTNSDTLLVHVRTVRTVHTNGKIKMNSTLKR